MALLQYLQRTDSLPDPRGSLSSTVLRQSIARMNQEVQAAVDLEHEVKERGNVAHTTVTVSGIVLPLAGTLHNMVWLLQQGSFHES